MRRSSIVIGVVLVAGYSMFGGLVLAGSVVHQSLADDEPLPESATASDRQADVGSESGSGEFQFRTVDAGLNYSSGSTYEGYGDAITDAGVYTADYDDDGWPDVLAIGNDTRGPVLFENADGSFEPSGALPGIERNVTAALWVDYDVDGRPDIVLLAEGSPPLLLENVGGSFEKRPSVFERSLSAPYGATTADYDRDGCPDLFVYQYGDWDEGLPKGFHNYSTQIDDDNGDPNYLYEGDCSGFTRVERTAVRGTRWTLAASFVDLDNDGWPDIHTANDFNHDIVYLNQGNGTFRQVALGERTNRNGMSSEVADVTGNGRLDVFVTNIYYPDWAAERINPMAKDKAGGNNLITSHGDGTFVMRANQYGIQAGGWGWAAVIADFDNDADEDLFQATQHLTFQGREQTFTPDELERLRDLPYYSFPAVWERSSLTSFDRVDAEASGFGTTDGRGVVRLDYDRDGDLDLVVATTDRYRVYENRMDRGNAVQLRVRDRNGSQTTAYGATVSVSGGEQQRRVHARTDFLSQDSRLVHIGIGNRTMVDVHVVWPDGTERTFEDVPAGQRLVVTPDGVQHRSELDGA